MVGLENVQTGTRVDGKQPSTASALTVARTALLIHARTRADRVNISRHEVPAANRCQAAGIFDNTRSREF